MRARQTRRRILVLVVALAAVAAPWLAAAASPRAQLADPASTLLQLDSGEAALRFADWEAGEQIGLRFRPPDIVYPLRVDQMTCLLTTHEESATSARLRAHVYLLADGVPVGPIASSATENIPFGAEPDIQQWVTLTFPEPALIYDPQPLMVAIELVGRGAQEPPSPVIDASSPIPVEDILYRATDGLWYEHYDYGWASPDEVGYTMLRAWVSTLDATLVTAEANAVLSSQQADTVIPAASSLLVGQMAVGWSMRTLVRFPRPTSPFAGAQLVDAALRLYQYGEVDQTRQLALDANVMTSSWTEAGATWNNAANAGGMLVGEAVIPAQNEGETPVDRAVYVGAGDAASGWLDGSVTNNGLMLSGDKDSDANAKRFRPRAYVASAHRPQLLLKWNVPVATPTPWGPTATPTQSATPTRPIQPGWLALPLVAGG